MQCNATPLQYQYTTKIEIQQNDELFAFDRRTDNGSSDFFICLKTTGRLARPHALLRLNSQSAYISS